MNQSFTSTFSAHSQYSLRSAADPAPPQLFGYLYDVPKDTKVAELKQVFCDNYIDCHIQIKREPAKPFDSAMVKFQSSAHLQVASEKLRYFQTTGGHKIRFLPFDSHLSRCLETTLKDCCPSQNSSSMSKSMLAGGFEDDKENQFDENLPDNSNLQCNLCVTGLDDSITSEDLHALFHKFGEIKSSKVAHDPKTGKSRSYGYVWFTTEKACSAAMAASKDLPYQVQLYRSFCIRECEPQQTTHGTVSIQGYP